MVLHREDDLGDHAGRLRPDQMRPEYLAGTRLDYELDDSPRIAVQNRAVETGEGEAADRDLLARLQRARFGAADAGDLRIDEGGAGHDARIVRDRGVAER